MEKINNIQTKNSIADMIKKEILFNRLKDGEELVQDTIAGKLGVSRMPVREAFQILEMEGFIQRLPNRHMVVRGVTQKSICEIFDLIEHIQISFIKEILHFDKDCGKEFTKLLNRYKMKEIKEIMLHNFFSDILDNLYLQLLHERLLNGYVAFVLEDLKISETEDTTVWDEIGEALGKKDETRLAELFHGYFTNLAGKMIKEVLNEEI